MTPAGDKKTFIPEWKLWIAKHDDAGKPFDIWFYTAAVGDFYSMTVFNYPDELGASPKENDHDWFWEIHYGDNLGDNPIAEGDADSREVAKNACVDTMLKEMLKFFVGTGDLLSGDLPNRSNTDDLVNKAWALSLEPATPTAGQDTWCYDIDHGPYNEFVLGLDLSFEEDARLVAPPEIGAWRWSFHDDIDTICKGTAPTRTLARQLCVAAFLDHLSGICAIAKQLRGLEFPAVECTDPKRPSRFRHDKERLDPDYKPHAEHPLTTALLRTIYVDDLPADRQAKLLDLCAEVSVDELRAAINDHRACCQVENCTILAAMERCAASRSQRT